MEYMDVKKGGRMHIFNENGGKKGDCYFSEIIFSSNNFCKSIKSVSRGSAVINGQTAI